jgi:hypothetical protein
MDSKPAEVRASLRIAQDLKRDIKVIAAQRGVHEYELIEEVWNFWVEHQKRKDQPGSAALTSGHRNQEEDELCQAVMDFWRDPAARAEDPGGIGAAVLDSFVKRFLAKRATGGF